MDRFNLTSIFQSIAATNQWGDPESISGPGSTLAATRWLRGELAKTFAQLNIRSLVDAPCGDMNWMRHVDYSFRKYTGVDIVPEMIESLKQQNFPPLYFFSVGNIATDILPEADAVLCRDCLPHLPFSLIHDVLELWARTGFKYIFTTTFPDWDKNEDCAPGEWRPLNLEAAPFHLPKPQLLIVEKSETYPLYRNKALGVWSF